MTSLRVVAYNFLAGGSPKRTGHWQRAARTLGADIIMGQECRPPGHFKHDRFRLKAEDGLHWQSVGEGRWGSGVYVRGGRLAPLSVTGFEGWVAGAEVSVAPWVNGRTVRLFSIHGPVGERGYVRTMHEILDRIAPFGHDADLLLGGDFNVAVGYRQPTEKRTISRGERELLDRLSQELGLMPCWQTANPGRPLAQTLRWTADRKVPYHCDGIFAPRAWQERLVSCRVVRGHRWYQMSDHNPVVAEFSVE